MSSPRLDEASLILVAATAAARTPEDVLAATDMAALARVTASIDEADDALDAAAVALVAIAKERPFGADSDATAWLACALIAPAEAAHAALKGADAIELVRRAARGEATWEQVRERLAATGTSCPACGQPLPSEAPTAGKRPAPRCTPLELVARCAVQNRRHGRFGRPFTKPTPVEDTPWRPVLANRRTGAMIVLADDAPLLLVPEGETYVVAEATFVAGDLVGDWRGVLAKSVVRTSVPARAVVLDAHASTIDTSRLDELLQPVLALA